MFERFIFEEGFDVLNVRLLGLKTKMRCRIKNEKILDQAYDRKNWRCLSTKNAVLRVRSFHFSYVACMAEGNAVKNRYVFFFVDALKILRRHKPKP